MLDQQVEKEIQAKGLTAPRVTPQHIEDVIASEHYFTGVDGFLGAYNRKNDVRVEAYKVDWEVPRSIQALELLTFCVLVLKNGFTVTGESACASPENFDAELGRKIARQNAVNKVWLLEGYLLKQRLSDL